MRWKSRIYASTNSDHNRYAYTSLMQELSLIPLYKNNSCQDGTLPGYPPLMCLLHIFISCLPLPSAYDFQLPITVYYLSLSTAFYCLLPITVYCLSLSTTYYCLLPILPITVYNVILSTAYHCPVSFTLCCLSLSTPYHCLLPVISN